MFTIFYHILCLADIHWGVKDPDEVYHNLSLVLDFLRQYREIDLLVIAGDYFDAKLSLNSTTASKAIYWMHQLVNTATEVGVKRIRVIKGTQEHDHDQLESFRSFEHPDGYFRIINCNTVEETLPGLSVIYCPDENINAEDYVEQYWENLVQEIDIGFFHGSFDIVLPDIVVQLSEETSMKSMIFNYDFWSRIVQGPMVAGHWHNGVELDHLIYIGSFDRWAFNEEQPKGFGFIRFDTETKQYLYQKIINTNAPEYITFQAETHLYPSVEHWKQLISAIEAMLKETDRQIKIRILIHLTDDKSENDTFITTIREYFLNQKEVKITVKNKLKSDKKQQEKQSVRRAMDTYQFIHEAGKTEAQIIQEFIRVSKQKEIPLEKIEQLIRPYMKTT